MDLNGKQSKGVVQKKRLITLNYISVFSSSDSTAVSLYEVGVKTNLYRSIIPLYLGEQGQ